MTDDFAIEGEDAGYVPCDELAAPLDAEEEGAISGMGTGFVAIDAEAATLPALEDAAIVGSGVGFVPKPCEQELEPCGPGFPNGPDLQSVWENLSPGTTSPLNTTAGTVVHQQGGVALPPGFVSPGDYSYVKWDSEHSTHLITCQPILRFTIDPGAILFEFLKNGSLIRSQIADIVPVGTGPDYYLAVADNDLLAPDFLCIATGDELSIWASGDLSTLVSVDQGRIRLQPYI